MGKMMKGMGFPRGGGGGVEGSRAFFFFFKFLVNILLIF